VRRDWLIGVLWPVSAAQMQVRGNPRLTSPLGRSNLRFFFTGCGSAWLERHVRDVEAVGSNPTSPIFPPGNTSIPRAFRQAAAECHDRSTHHFSPLTARRSAFP
jgi:hypothetical protein